MPFKLDGLEAILTLGLSAATAFISFYNIIVKIIDWISSHSSTKKKLDNLIKMNQDLSNTFSKYLEQDTQYKNDQRLLYERLKTQVDTILELNKK